MGTSLRYAVISVHILNQIPFRILTVQILDEFHSCLLNLLSLSTILLFFIVCSSLTGCTLPKKRVRIHSRRFYLILRFSQIGRKLGRGWHKSDRYRDE